MFSKTSYLPFILFAAAIVAALPAQANEHSLKKDFAALAEYELGQSELPLRRIAEAVRTAGNEAVDGAALEQALIAILEEEATPEAKRFSCRMLGELGGPDSIAALAAQLNAPALFHTAITALEQIPYSESTTALAQAIPAFAGSDRAALLAALGRQGNVEAVPALAAHLEEGDPAIRYTASQALADINTPEACMVVLDAFSVSDASAQALLSDALLTCAAPLLDTDEKEDVTTALHALSNAPFPSQTRLAANTLLMRTIPEQAQTLLLAMLRDDDAVLASEALMLARQMPTPAVTEALLMILDEVDDEQKPPFLEVLGDRGDTQALSAVRSLANHAVPEVRRAALRATGQLGDATLTRFLLERASSGPMDEQRIAREALARMPGEAVNVRLLHLAQAQGEQDMRVRAIALLAERRANQASDELYQLALASSVPDEVRVAALQALRPLASPGMLDDLIEIAALQDAERLRAALPQTIADVASRKHFEESMTAPDEIPADAALPVVRFMQAMETEDADPESLPTVRTILLETLALMGTEAAFNEARNMLGNVDKDVRRAAINALTRFQRTEALDELKARVLQESDPDLRALAYSAYLGALRNAGALPRRDVDDHLAFASEQALTAAARRDFLATASRLPSPACLRLIEAFLDDEEVAAEAIRSALTVSTALTGAWPDLARPRLEAIAAQEHTPALAEEAQKALAFMNTFDGHLMSWEMAGPYYEENTMAHALFEHTFPPEIDAESANWRVFPLLTDASPPFMLEIDRVLGGEERVVFLRTFIDAETDSDALLELGTNDGCRVWWNGELIHSLNVARALTPAEDILPVRLEQGVNSLMIAVFQHGAAWAASARLTDLEGQPLHHVTARPVKGD